MEFLQMKRGHSDEENEEEVIREVRNFPVSHSSSSYGSSNHHQRLCLGPSFDDVGEEDAATRSYHGAAAAATKIQEVELIDLTPTNTNDESYKHAGSSSASVAGGLWSIEKEHMFDKVVTPSDVGKLNRLVIPKQHAEKYFPLDSSTNEKGLLLNFEDRYGKPWRFRYSYWNSSQSYVITKGWSRFVKEKKLDAGDIVSFERGIGEPADKDHRMFIDWRHRPTPPPDHAARNHPTTLVSPAALQQFPISPSSPLWGRRLYQYPLLRRPYLRHQNQRDPSWGTSTHDYHYAFSSSSSSSSASHDQIRDIPTTMVNSAPSSSVVHMISNAAAPKRLRLFGVNMDCSVPQESNGMVLPSVPYVTTANSVLYPHPPFSSLPPPPSRPHDGSPMPFGYP